MNPLSDFLIAVNYHPCDPGNTTWYSERTRIPREGLIPGKSLHYKDPGDLFEAIKVLSVSDDALVIAYCDETYTLDREQPSLFLDEDGRDYTEFELCVAALFGPDDEDEEKDDREEEDDDYEDDDGRWDPYV